MSFRGGLQVEVVHIMSDGTKRDSVKGFVVPYNEETKGYYLQIIKFHEENFEKIKGGQPIE